MIKFIVFIFAIATVTNARPKEEIELQNVVTVPPNCNPGQQWVNGACRDVWRIDLQPHNMITVPPNCPPGQVFINGACRDVWRRETNDNDDIFDIRNVVTVPTNCPAGQQWVNGACRDVWRSDGEFPKNMITVPPNCPPGQEYINGACRDVWKRSSNLLERQYKLEEDTNDLGDNKQIDSFNKNIINVPNQCPAGFKPDALGVCREILP